MVTGLFAVYARINTIAIIGGNLRPIGPDQLWFPRVLTGS
jgi:hypothetical protein